MGLRKGTFLQNCFFLRSSFLRKAPQPLETERGIHSAEMNAPIIRSSRAADSKRCGPVSSGHPLSGTCLTGGSFRVSLSASPRGRAFSSGNPKTRHYDRSFPDFFRARRYHCRFSQINLTKGRPPLPQAMRGHGILYENTVSGLQHGRGRRHAVGCTA